MRPETHSPEVPMRAPALVDINEISRRFNIPKGAIYNWVYLRRIPFIKAGRCLRFDPEDMIRSLPHSTTMIWLARGRRSL